ncbi:MAG TPA: flagellin [Caulobacteraceae bacterium]|jgi:flagellin|nr:flagellin [Caulobacteraceae bacterium]
MSFSVNNNPGALVALQNLNETSQQLATAQNIVSTGLQVASAKDNGAIWAIAQNERSTVQSLDAVKSSLQTGQSIIDVANSAGTTVSNLLTQMQEKALAASDTSLDTNSRAALNNDFVALRNQITSTVQNADFNGVNLLDGSVAQISSLANSQGTSVLTTQGEDLSLGGSIVTLAATATISTITSASAQIAICQTSLTNVDNALASLGTASTALDTHLNFVSNLQDTLTTGIGNLVNADLAKESATLQALQTKQQLGIQALSIANSASQALLGLFR